MRSPAAAPDPSPASRRSGQVKTCYGAPIGASWPRRGVGFTIRTITYLSLSWSPMADAKTIRENQLLGERGIAFITEIVLKMGYVFRATPVLDGGIDGEIELRDRYTGAISNQIIKVQSKAVSKFANETDDRFDFWPSSKDVKYWLGGNVPVIVVVSCPDRREAYWVSVQDYKNANPTTKGIHFDKAKTRLDSGAA